MDMERHRQKHNEVDKEIPLQLFSPILPRVTRNGIKKIFTGAYIYFWGAFFSKGTGKAKRYSTRSSLKCVK